MPANIKDLQSELEALQTERANFDLPVLRAALAIATEAHRAHPESPNWPDLEQARLRQDVSLAKNALENATHTARSLDGKIGPLETLLNAPKRAAQAGEDLAALRSQAQAAQATVDSAQATVDTLRGQHADASAQLSADRDHTAKAILAAAKEGKALAPVTPDRGAVLALEAALGLAESEHAAAVQTLAEIQSRIAATEVELKRATMDSAALQFELVQRDFVQACVAYRATDSEFVIDDSLMQRVEIAESTAQSHAAAQ